MSAEKCGKTLCRTLPQKVRHAALLPHSAALAAEGFLSSVSLHPTNNPAAITRTKPLLPTTSCVGRAILPAADCQSAIAVLHGQLHHFTSPIRIQPPKAP